MKFITEYTSTDNNIGAKYHKERGGDDSKTKTKKNQKKSQRQVEFFVFSKH